MTVKSLTTDRRSVSVSAAAGEPWRCCSSCSGWSDEVVIGDGGPSYPMWSKSNDLAGGQEALLHPSLCTSRPSYPRRRDKAEIPQARVRSIDRIDLVQARLY